RMVKITGGQRIDLLGLRKEQLPAVWEELEMPSGHAYAKAVRTVKTCVGTDFCRFGLGDAIAVGIELERRMEGLYTPHKVKSAVSGCPRNCAESYVKDIGLVAVDAEVVDPAIQAELIERFAIAKAAADPDPWLERHSPVHPKQFAELDSEPELVTPVDAVLAGSGDVW